MRKVLLSLLLATTIATPALAQRGERDRSSDRSERAERAEARQQRAERAREQRADRAERAQRVREERRSDAPPVVRRGGPAAVEPPAVRVAPPVMRRGGPATVERPPVQVAPPAGVTERDRRPVADNDGVRRPNVNRRGRPTLGREDSPGSVANWRGADRVVPGGQRLGRRTDGRDGRVAPPPGARPDRPAPPPATTAHRDRRDGDWRDRRGRDGRHRDGDWRDGRDRHPEWRRDWRDDRRYDWRRWRDRNRSSFHLGLYLDPFGWGYQRYNVGWRLWPSYYSSRYWLNDPWSYRLPQAPWPYRWVRYHNDAVLVNTMTGEVQDVIYGMFW